MNDIIERLAKVIVSSQPSYSRLDMDGAHPMAKQVFSVMADENERLREALTIALSALVAATSLLKRSEDEKVKPSRAVASNKIFRLMMADYERAEDNARAALLGEKE